MQPTLAIHRRKLETRHDGVIFGAHDRETVVSPILVETGVQLLQNRWQGLPRWLVAHLALATRHERPVQDLGIFDPA